MKFSVAYCEQAVSYTLYPATRKAAEDLALRLIEEGHENVTVGPRPSRSDALGCLIMTKSPKPLLWKRNPLNVS